MKRPESNQFSNKISKPFYRSDQYRWQTDPKNSNRIDASVIEALRRFFEIKRYDPYAEFGKNDKPFSHILAREIPGIRKANLSYDARLVYRVDRGIIFLYGIYSHDDLGIGTPPNINRQRSMTKTFKNMNFSESDQH